MESIRCRVSRCAHNMAGGCDAGTVFMLDDMDGGAFCRTFTYSAETDNTVSSVSARGMAKCAERGCIACAVRNCAHNSGGLCICAAVHVDDEHGAAICRSRKTKAIGEKHS